MNGIVKLVIALIVGILIGVGVMFCVNLLPEPYAKKNLITLNGNYLPTLKLVSEDVKLISNEVTDKEISLKYNGSSVSEEMLVSYCELLKKFGYRILKNNLQSQEENTELMAVFAAGQEELVYITCSRNAEAVNVKYALEKGAIEVVEAEKYTLYDARYQYYDVEIDDKTLKVPSLDNVVVLERNTNYDYASKNYTSLQYNYEENTTAEQKSAYLSKYGDLLLEHGFYQGKDEREFRNGSVKVSIMNDFYFYITITKNYD